MSREYLRDKPQRIDKALQQTATLHGCWFGIVDSRARLTARDKARPQMRVGEAQIVDTEQRRHHVLSVCVGAKMTHQFFDCLERAWLLVALG